MIRSELIGSRITIAESRNATLIGVTGTVVDETRHLLVIQTGKGNVKVHKAACIFEIRGEQVEGKSLEMSPEDRAGTK
ncbi:ribonuclease P protein subunit [Candidatus Woesearchaeota archaeon]|nr:ribonuclease P protein subunit [Candidatus Woesearchaeota archaeon]